MIHAQTWDLLAEALEDIDYSRDIEPGWKRFHLSREDEDNYAILYIYTHNPNTYRPTEIRHTRHEFVVPVATYNRDAWIRWVFDCITKIELHETAECFKVNGERIYAPHHGNGEDPYAQWFASWPEKKLKAPGED